MTSRQARVKAGVLVARTPDVYLHRRFLIWLHLLLLFKLRTAAEKNCGMPHHDVVVFFCMHVDSDPSKSTASR